MLDADSVVLSDPFLAVWADADLETGLELETCESCGFI